MKNTALLAGPYDWDPALLQQAEFQSRLAPVRKVLAERQASALVVHGNSLEYGALAYLTGFVPKLGPAFALIEINSPIRLLVAGSPAMLPAAKRLTWVKDVRPMGDLKGSLAEWLSHVARTDQAAIGLWGDDLMALRASNAIHTAIQPFGRIVELRACLDSLRVEKSSREREMLRRACGILAAASKELLRADKGAGLRSAALAAESAAFENGAQDVRILASARDGGPPVAFDGPSDPVLNPIIACIAVKFAGYWAEGFVTSDNTSGGAVAGAQRALSAMLAQARPGVTFRELESLGEKQISPYKPHSFIANRAGNSIGLTLEEMPETESPEDLKLRIGGVYTLRAGAAGASSDNAIVSAMIAVEDSKIEILWSAIGPTNNPRPNRDSQ